MEIEVQLEKIDATFTHLHGGGYASQHVTIYIDSTLPYHEQREIVIHEVIEIHCPSWEHEKISELVQLIQDALDKLDEKNSEENK